jgi:hypothetical protein
MAVIAGSPHFENYLYSQKLPSLNLSFHHDLDFIYSWNWTLAKIRYRLFMICHELLAFKTCGTQELSGSWLSRLAETAIQILSLQAVFLDISSHNLLQHTVFWRPKHTSLSKCSQVCIKSAVNLSLFEEVWYTMEQQLLVICRFAEQKLCFEIHSLKLQLDYAAQ